MLKAWTEVLLIRSIYFYPGLYVKFSWKKQEGRESAIGCYLYNLFIYAAWGVVKWAKEVQSLDS